MTEVEWLACTDPQSILNYLKGKVSNRKLRLFAVACCRRVWHLLPDERSRNAVDLSEGYADGSIGKQQLSAAHSEVDKVLRNYRHRRPLSLPIERRRWWAATEAAKATARPTDRATTLADEIKQAAHSASIAERMDHTCLFSTHVFQVQLLRCVIGLLPFRSATADPTWMTWNNGTIWNLAGTIYQDRRFAELPILADALEDAGCTDQALLEHLRGPGPHGRGCWALDLVLGRE